MGGRLRNTAQRYTQRMHIRDDVKRVIQNTYAFVYNFCDIETIFVPLLTIIKMLKAA